MVLLMQPLIYCISSGVDHATGTTCSVPKPLLRLEPCTASDHYAMRLRGQSDLVEN
jgi:hypothetical protein